MITSAPLRSAATPITAVYAQVTFWRMGSIGA